jgi:hypothetical protein
MIVRDYNNWGDDVFFEIEYGVIPDMNQITPSQRNNPLATATK